VKIVTGLIIVRNFTLEDFSPALKLWEHTPGVGVGQSDQKEAIQIFLERNPGLSFVAVTEAGQVVGTVLSGHDGRRGYLYHLAVNPDHRRLGIGRRLVDAATQALAAAGISKVHLFVFDENELGKAFWRSRGWTPREDLKIMSLTLK
jgi:ribosomal protein S18 acetylase RimI-like enzyme